jgi:hypothetical protein
MELFQIQQVVFYQSKLQQFCNSKFNQFEKSQVTFTKKKGDTVVHIFVPPLALKLISKTTCFFLPLTKVSKSNEFERS